MLKCLLFWLQVFDFSLSLFFQSLPLKDIIRQPSEDEIIKLAPPPKKAWGCNPQPWSLHLDFFTPINWPTVSNQPLRYPTSPPTHLTHAYTHTHARVPPSVTQNHTGSHLQSNQSDRSDAASSRAEGRRGGKKKKKGHKKKEIWRRNAVYECEERERAKVYPRFKRRVGHEWV